YLILAMGARTGYFGKDEWRKHTEGLKSIVDALEIRKRLLFSFEQAEVHPELATKLLNYIIIGGGPTGVELSGSIAELSRQIISTEFRFVHPDSIKVTLIEAGPELLPSFSADLSAYTKEQLEKRRVKVMTGTRVQNIDERGVHLPDGTLLESNLIIWAAGVEANPFTEKLGVPVDKGKRVIVTPFCSLEQHPEIFVVGDMAMFKDEEGKPLPGVSPVAMQQGRHVARTIRDELKGKPRQIFHYFDKGNMATIGRATAIAEVGKLKFRGLIGWLAWLFVHLIYQVGFKNQLSTLIIWMWSYITPRAGARVIQEPARSEPKTAPVTATAPSAATTVTV
ncbi:MAG: NAD(P)/FAD-dependent oxidoreductase, partial [Ferruginibacter sp.]|nr:NAD(P)/FAD-dependent oxidoreductase [Cytophagales bacterium]